METIYPPNNYVCTEKLPDLIEYFKEFSKDYYPVGKIHHETHQTIFKDDLSLEEFETVSNACNIDQLIVENECEPMDVDKCYKTGLKDLPDAAKGLQTIQAKIKWEKRMFKDLSRDTEQINLLQDFNESIDFQPGTELMINVKVHQPFSSHNGEQGERRYRQGLFKTCHEIVALGSQSLKELKNKIICDNRKESNKEVKNIYENNKDDVDLIALTKNASSLICMDDKLYVDVPRSDSVDYSNVVKKWNEENKLNLNFSSENMNVKLHNLNFRLGYPYLYQHNGDCEHLFVFSDIQLTKKSHSLCLEDYPYYKSINSYILKYCNICKKIPAKWLCTNNKRLIHDITYFCQDCLISYNYKDGEKVGDFKLYPQKKILIHQ